MELTAAEIWQQYRRGVNWHHSQSLYTKTEKCHRFYEGDQWRDAKGSIGDDLPVYNIIRPTVDYKTAMIAQNSMVIHYSPSGSDPREMVACRLLNRMAAKKWDQLKMDTLLWQCVKEAAITGDSFLYFYNGALSSQMLTTDRVFLGDEQEPDIQKQPYLILQERQPVEDVRRQAIQNGLSQEQAALIQPDSADQSPHRFEEELGGGASQKCTTLLYMTRRQGEVAFCRCTGEVIYQPMQRVPGLRRYPIAKLTWLGRHGCSRGGGEVWRMIPNQVEINKNLYRRLESVKATAFPKPVYVEGAVENPDSIAAVGTPVRVREGSVQRLGDLFTYLQPAAISGDAKALQDELLEITRSLASAGDNALGNIDPEQASGAAIAAVKEAQGVPLNEHKAAARQFVEDIALIWLDLAAAYGLGGGPAARLPEGLQPDIRIDVSDGSPYSKYAREQALENALAAGHITFEEYVAALDEDAHAPKAKFAEILKARQTLPAPGGDGVAAL